MVRARVFVVTLTALLAGWLAVAAGAAGFGGLDTLIVPMGRDGFVGRLPDDVFVAGRAGPFLIFTGDGETLARDLRRAGALLILPARAKTCLDLQGWAEGVAPAQQTIYTGENPYPKDAR